MAVKSHGSALMPPAIAHLVAQRPQHVVRARAARRSSANDQSAARRSAGVAGIRPRSRPDGAVTAPRAASRAAPPRSRSGRSPARRAGSDAPRRDRPRRPARSRPPDETGRDLDGLGVVAGDRDRQLRVGAIGFAGDDRVADGVEHAHEARAGQVLLRREADAFAVGLVGDRAVACRRRRCRSRARSCP